MIFGLISQDSEMTGERNLSGFSFIRNIYERENMFNYCLLGLRYIGKDVDLWVYI